LPEALLHAKAQDEGVALSHQSVRVSCCLQEQISNCGLEQALGDAVARAEILDVFAYAGIVEDVEFGSFSLSSGVRLSQVRGLRLRI
jgi:hypothetical protein